MTTQTNIQAQSRTDQLGREAMTNGRANYAVPRHRVVDEQTAVQVLVELPGVEPGAVEVSQTGRTLEVRAERRLPQVPETARVLVKEFSDVDFRVEFVLPRWLATESVEAAFDAGILKLTLRRSLPEKRTIPVASS